MKQTDKKQVIIVKDLLGNLTFIEEDDFVKQYKDYDFEFVKSLMYIRHDRLRRFTKNGIKAFIDKLKKKYNEN